MIPTPRNDEFLLTPSGAIKQYSAQNRTTTTIGTCQMRSPQIGWMPIIILLGCATAQRKGAPDAAHSYASLDGSLARAMNVAITDFSKSIDLSPEVKDRVETVSKCMARPESYDYVVSQKDDAYIITIFTTDRCDPFKGARIFGGGGEYMIDKKSFAIRKKSLQD